MKRAFRLPIAARSILAGVVVIFVANCAAEGTRPPVTSSGLLAPVTIDGQVCRTEATGDWMAGTEAFQRTARRTMSANKGSLACELAERNLVRSGEQICETRYAFLDNYRNIRLAGVINVRCRCNETDTRTECIATGDAVCSFEERVGPPNTVCEPLTQ